MRTISVIKNILFLIISIVLLGCESMLSPELDNVYGEERASTIPQTALGFLNTAYLSLPIEYDFSECATDDAVSNDLYSPYPRMVSGAWNDLSDPLNIWGSTYHGIININQFFTYLDDIVISWSNAESDSLYRERWHGEAYGMRAYLHLMLLQYYGGKGRNGEMLGIPYIDKVLTISKDDWQNITRPPYTETVEKIAHDLDSAIKYLPLDYAGSSNTITGLKNRGRFTQRIAYASKARLYLHAGSPLYNGGNYNIAYCDSATKYAALAIGTRAPGTSMTNQLFYTTDSPSSSEIIWRLNMLYEATDYGSMMRSREGKNYPPSRGGLGQVNPTQNFVDAFSDANGYPITHPLSNYDPNNPYANRNGRLDSIVIRDGGQLLGRVIHTSKDDQKDGIENTGATRTGYYLKKLLRPDVSITDPVAGKKNSRPLMRTTEMYLIFAEALMASKGPDETYLVGSTNRSARSVMLDIRRRSGIPRTDPYATNLSADDFMDLIRNERRIELAFEGFRFTDIRRWGLSLNSTVYKARILNAGDTPEILPITEEPRVFSSFKYFAPIPNVEILKCPELIQNSQE